MRIVATLAVRNERPYLANCLNHLIANGIDYLIVDNDSDDGTAELLQHRHFAPHLAAYRRYPYQGVFEWENLLRAMEESASEIDADWTVLLGADEIMHSYRPDETLAEAIARIDVEGYDVINFDEFVFLPIDDDYTIDHPGMQPFHWYYHHCRPRHYRARRKLLRASHLQDGGHSLHGAPIKLATETIALRHYMFRSQDHALRKYTERKFHQTEIDRGWHENRIGFERDRFVFPPSSKLEWIEDPAERNLSREHSRNRHYWEWSD